MSIMAWRTWRVHTNRGLYGLFGGFWLPDKTMQAECALKLLAPQYLSSELQYLPMYFRKHSDYDVPDTNCTCGVYALKRLPSKHPYVDQRIVGVVEIWGKIITAKHGYRAEYARLRALTDRTDDIDPLLLTTIANAYRVPLLTVRRAKKEFFR